MTLAERTLDLAGHAALRDQCCADLEAAFATGGAVALQETLARLVAGHPAYTPCLKTHAHLIVLLPRALRGMSPEIRAKKAFVRAIVRPRAARVA